VPKYAKFLLDSGVKGVLGKRKLQQVKTLPHISIHVLVCVPVNGTSGEGVSQTVEEREKIAEAWLTASKKTGQTIVVQVGGTNLADVKRLAAHAEKHGADGLLCLADLFHKPTNADQLLDYLKIVSDSAPNTPLLYYHIPLFTGIDSRFILFISLKPPKFGLILLGEEEDYLVFLYLT
jgi:N-acetylneuraminate lyase